jgi:hypothetical protein
VNCGTRTWIARIFPQKFLQARIDVGIRRTSSKNKSRRERCDASIMRGLSNDSTGDATSQLRIASATG